MSHVSTTVEAVGDDLLGARRAHVTAEWPNVRVEGVRPAAACTPPLDADESSTADRTTRACVRLGKLTPADVLVELVTPAGAVARRMWCEQSYHNGSVAYVVREPLGVEGSPDAYLVRVTPASDGASALGLPPAVGRPFTGGR